MIPQFLSATAKSSWQKNYTEAVISGTAKYEQMIIDATTAAQKATVKEQRDKEIFYETINTCSRQFLISEQPAMDQKTYLTKYLDMRNYEVSDFIARLQQINEYFEYFPPRYVGGPPIQKLSEDELVAIVIDACPVEFKAQMLLNNINPNNLPLKDLITHLQRLERVTKFKNAANSTTTNMQLSTQNEDGNNNQSDRKKRKAYLGGQDNNKPNRNVRGTTTKPTCTICSRNHATEKCWWNPDNKDNRLNKQSYKNSTAKLQKATQEAIHTIEEVRTLMRNLPMFNTTDPPKKKRRVSLDDTDSGSDGVAAKETPTSYFCNEVQCRSQQQRK
jgi:hypothetical protein